MCDEKGTLTSRQNQTEVNQKTQFRLQEIKKADTCKLLSHVTWQHKSVYNSESCNLHYPFHVDIIHCWQVTVVDFMRFIRFYEITVAVLSTCFQQFNNVNLVSMFGLVNWIDTLARRCCLQSKGLMYVIQLSKQLFKRQDWELDNNKCKVRVKTMNESPAVCNSNTS